MSDTYKKGILFAVCTTLISGFSIFFNKFAVGLISPPLLFTATKNIAVGILIVAVLLLTAKWKKIGALNKKEWKYLILIGLIGGTIPFYLFFTGLAHTTAINAAIIQKTLVIWTVLLAGAFLKERLNMKQVIAIVLLFGSNLLVGGFKGFQLSTGEMYIFAATLFWGVEYVLAKKVLKTVDPDIVSGARMGFGSLVLFAASALFYPKAVVGLVHLSATQWLLMGVSVTALFAYVLTWYRALKFASVITVTTILVASTLVTNILTAVFVTHSLNSVAIIQNIGLTIGVAVFLYSLRSEKKVQKPAVV